MYIDNNWYSHRSILAEYCEVKDVPILGSIQHGAHIADLNKDLGKHRIPFAKHFCWSRNVYENAIKCKIKNVVPIGAPFLYLDKISNKVKDSKGTLTFPAHSNPDDPRYFKHEIFIKNIMDNYPGPYTVCLFFLDYDDNIQEIYKKYDWNIVSAGSRLNKNFLKNIYNFIQKNEYCVSTELGTSLFYSLYLNKKSSYKYKYRLNNNDYYFSKGSNNFKFRDQFMEYKKVNNFLLNDLIDNERGKNLADIELGKEFIKSKEELRLIIGFDNKLKKTLAKFLGKLINIKYKRLRNF